MLGNRTLEGLVPFQSRRKERTQRSPIRGPRTQCGPSKPPRNCGAISASLEGSPPRPSTAPRASASLEAIPRRKGQTALPLTLPSYGGIKCQPLLHSAQVRRRQPAIPHSSCDRSPVRQLQSLLRHHGRCGSTVEPATRDETGSVLLPLLFCQLWPFGLYLITRMAPDPPPAWEGGPTTPRAPPGGTLSTRSRRPGPPPSRGPGPPRNPRTSLVRTPALYPGGYGTAACPATTGARRALTCRTHGTPRLED